jgi:chaperone required for assembly of F1-ATPase
MKRFWDSATFVREADGFAIMLDSRPLRLPGGIRLLLPSEALAEAIAAEWRTTGDGDGGNVRMDLLPLTRLAATMQESVAPKRLNVVGELGAFAASDMLCYRAGYPPELAARQAARWQWLLDRAATVYGARLNVTTGIIPVPQTGAALAALHDKLHALSNADLAALRVVVPATCSLVLGLSLADGAINGAETTGLAFLDEDFQAELWGEDAEALARRNTIAADIDAAARFMALGRC